MTNPARRNPQTAARSNETDSGKAAPVKSRIRVITDLDGLKPAEAKSRFARNLDELLKFIGMSRKDAAAEIGISYPLIRRLATAGVSRIDDLNAVSLGAIADFLGLDSPFSLWKERLLRYVLTSGNCRFTEIFRDRLLAEQRRRQSLLDNQSREELGLINEALGVGPVASQRLPRQIEQKIAAILESPKKRQFLTLIDDYYDFVTREDARRVV